MLLNSLLGRFGIDIYSTVTRTVDKHKLDHLETTRKVTNKEVLYNERFLVTYNPLLDKEKCKEFNLDIVKVHRREIIENRAEITRGLKNLASSIVISDAVTSYGKIHMANLLKQIKDLGGDIFYTDTDSIVTNITLDKSFVERREIGKLKLEHVFREGFFVSNKTYCLVLPEGGNILSKDKKKYSNLIIKAKGGDKQSLDLPLFRSLLEGNYM